MLLSPFIFACPGEHRRPANEPACLAIATIYTVQMPPETVPHPGPPRPYQISHMPIPAHKALEQGNATRHPLVRFRYATAPAGPACRKWKERRRPIHVMASVCPQGVGHEMADVRRKVCFVDLALRTLEKNWVS